MFRDFLISFRLRNVYKVNGTIYSLKQLPIINKLLPEKLYESKGLKIFGNIVSILIEIIAAVLGKILYLLLMLMTPLSYYKTNPRGYIFKYFNIPYNNRSIFKYIYV